MIENNGIESVVVPPKNALEINKALKAYVEANHKELGVTVAAFTAFMKSGKGRSSRVGTLGTGVNSQGKRTDKVLDIPAIAQKIVRQMQGPELVKAAKSVWG